MAQQVKRCIRLLAAIGERGQHGESPKWRTGDQPILAMSPCDDRPMLVW